MKTGHLGQEALGVSFNTGRDTHPDTWTHHVGGLTSRLLDSTEGPPPGRWSASEEEVGHVASANALGRSLPGFHTLRKQNSGREPGREPALLGHTGDEFLQSHQCSSAALATPGAPGGGHLISEGEGKGKHLPCMRRSGQLTGWITVKGDDERWAEVAPNSSSFPTRCRTSFLPTDSPVGVPFLFRPQFVVD